MYCCYLFLQKALTHSRLLLLNSLLQAQYVRTCRDQHALLPGNSKASHSESESDKTTFSCLLSFCISITARAGSVANLKLHCFRIKNVPNDYVSRQIICV